MLHVPRPVRWLVLLAWTALISYWSGQTNLPIDTPEVAWALSGQQHLLAHASAFGMVGLLAYWCLGGLPGAPLGAWVFVAVFGALDEWHQSFTPGRAVELTDWIVDVAAGALAIGVANVLPRVPRYGLPSMSMLFRGRLAAGALAALLVMGVVGAGLKADPAVVRRQAARTVHVIVPDPVERRAAVLVDRATQAARYARTQVQERLTD